MLCCAAALSISANADLCLQGSMTKEQKDAGLASVYKRDDGQKRKETDVRMQEAAFVPDAYGECYPGYHELGTAVVDDDEADFTAMDSKVSSPFACIWTRSCTPWNFTMLAQIYICSNG